MRSAPAVALFGSLLAFGCRPILGVDPLDYQEPASSTSTGAGGSAQTCPEVDLSSDAKNCGACGHDCLGGDCDHGVCLPVVVVADEQAPFDLAVVGDWLFWTDAYFGGEVRACRKADCQPQTLLKVPSNATVPWSIAARAAPDAMALLYVPVYADHLPQPGVGFHRMVFDTVTGEKTVDQHDGSDWFGARGVVADDTAAYFPLLFDSRWIARVSADGTELGTFVDSGHSEPNLDGPMVAMDDEHVYLALGSLGDVYRIAKDDTSIEKIASGLPSITRIAVDGTWLYWGSVSDFGVTVWKKSKDGTGPVTTLYAHAEGASDDAVAALVTDATHAYFTVFAQGDGPDGALRRTRIDGSDARPETLADHLSGPEGLVLDEGAVYWANQYEGTILRLAKPPAEP